MTEDTSPENLRKFLDSDDPALVRMGLSMAKGFDLSENLKGSLNLTLAERLCVISELDPIEENWKAAIELLEKNRGKIYAEKIIALLIIDAEDSDTPGWFSLLNKIESRFGYGNYADLFWNALGCLPEAFERLGTKGDIYVLGNEKEIEILYWLVQMHHDSVGYHTQKHAMQNLIKIAADEHSQKTLKEMAEVLIQYASKEDKDVESIEILANDGLKNMLTFCEDEVQILVAQHLRKLGMSEEKLEEWGYEE